jgi:3-methyladenine DNA glycosylase/8-oxoguanine DNA glycosylase
MQIDLPARPPFSLPAVVRSHGWIQLAPFEPLEEQGAFRYVDRLASSRVVDLRLAPAPSGVSLTVDADLLPSEQAEVERKLAWMLGLGQDFSPFYALASQEPKLAHVVEQVRGRILRSPTFFEDVLKTILTTNTAWGGTLRMVSTLVRRLGSPLCSDPERRAFPTPDQIAPLNEAALRETIRLGYRSPYVLSLARAVVEGSLDLEAFKTSDLPTPELRAQLLAIKGVGAYAAANLLVLLGRYDYLPVDSWALKVVSHEWYEGQPIGPAEVEAAFEGWGEWKGLAYWFWDWSYYNQA